jgi:hypothetical protein
METTIEIFQQFKSDWKIASDDPHDVHNAQDEVFEKYGEYINGNPELMELIEEFINKNLFNIE